MHLMSAFWARGGVLTLRSAWRAKSEALDDESVHPLESLEMERWEKFTTRQQRKVMAEYVGHKRGRPRGLVARDFAAAD